MAVPSLVLPLQMAPGIYRDSTRYDSPGWITGENVRFYQKKPLKIGGYESVFGGFTVPATSMFSVPRSNTVSLSIDVYCGFQDRLGYFTFYENGTAGLFVDRTPVGWVDNPYNLAKFQSMTFVDESANSISYVIAYNGINRENLNSSEPGKVYLGSVDNDLPFIDITPSTPVASSGGITVIGNYLFLYGEKSLVQWSSANLQGSDIVDLGAIWPTNNFAVLGSTKVIEAMPVYRGTAPSGLFWTLDNLWFGTLVPGQSGDTFSFTLLDDDISIMSSKSVVKFGQNYIWMGVDQFYIYNGAVSVFENSTNLKFLFDNINYSAREKVWSSTNKKYREIQWYVPLFGADEPNWCITYNMESQCWYDYPMARTAGIPSSKYIPFPVMADAEATDNYGIETNPLTKTYAIWAHEKGVNRVQYGNSYAIKASVTSKYYTWLDVNNQANYQIQTTRFEPDFVMNGELQLTIDNYNYPDGPLVATESYSFDGTNKVDTRAMGRFVTFTFETNVIDGDFFLGKPLVHIAQGDERPRN